MITAIQAYAMHCKLNGQQLGGKEIGGGLMVHT